MNMDEVKKVIDDAFERELRKDAILTCEEDS